MSHGHPPAPATEDPFGDTPAPAKPADDPFGDAPVPAQAPNELAEDPFGEAPARQPALTEDPFADVGEDAPAAEPRREVVQQVADDPFPAGNDVNKVKVHGPPKLVAAGQDLPFVVVSPQCPTGEFWDTTTLAALVEHVIATHDVDPDRVYLTGRAVLYLRGVICLPD